MRIYKCALVIWGIILPELSTAWSLPRFHFRLPFSSESGPLSAAAGSQTVLESAEAKTSPLRIAIIGAGSGGSSAAFWIAKAKERHQQNVHVDVYERSDYIGGRMYYYCSFVMLGVGLNGLARSI